VAFDRPRGHFQGQAGLGFEEILPLPRSDLVRGEIDGFVVQEKPRDDGLVAGPLLVEAGIGDKKPLASPVVEGGDVVVAEVIKAVLDTVEGRLRRRRLIIRESIGRRLDPAASHRQVRSD